MQKYWYRFHWVVCPVCGQEFHYQKERMFTPKPEEHHLRYVCEDRYDYCEV